MFKVLIADDDAVIADLLAEILSQNGYDVVGTARTASEAVRLGLKHRPDLAVLDLHLADGSFGTEIAPRLGLPNIRVIYTAGEKGGLTAADGHAYLRKPYRYDDLLRSLEMVSDDLATG